MYRDMIKLGKEGIGELVIGPNSRNWIQLPPGGVNVNAADYLRLNLNNVIPHVDGWYSGVASFDFNNWHVGHWRQFLFCARNADAPSVVHFEPFAELVGWQPTGAPKDVEQYVYSFSIRATFSQAVDR